MSVSYPCNKMASDGICYFDNTDYVELWLYKGDPQGSYDSIRQLDPMCYNYYGG